MPIVHDMVLNLGSWKFVIIVSAARWMDGNVEDMVLLWMGVQLNGGLLGGKWMEEIPFGQHTSVLQI